MKLIKIFVANFLILNSGCIHTESVEKKSFEKPIAKQSIEDKYDQIILKYVIYNPSQFPLNRFFVNLRKGEYESAFKKINFSYTPSNTSDELLQEFINEGFIPAYVEIENTGKSPININEKNFEIQIDGKNIKAFYSSSLPNEFKNISSKAIAANIYNTGVIIVGFTAVIAALAIATASSSSGGPDFSATPLKGFKTIGNPYNPVTKTTQVEGFQYLFSPGILLSQQKRTGLLFFNVGKESNFEDSLLKFVNEKNP